MERPMRSKIAIALVSIVVAATLPAVAQQPAPPAQVTPPGQVTPPVQATPPPPATPPAQPTPAQNVAPTTPAVQPARIARVSHRRTGHGVRHRHESICSIVNGWHAFNNRYDPKG